MKHPGRVPGLILMLPASEPSTKQMRISAVHHTIAGVPRQLDSTATFRALRELEPRVGFSSHRAWLPHGNVGLPHSLQGPRQPLSELLGRLPLSWSYKMGWRSHVARRVQKLGPRLCRLHVYVDTQVFHHLLHSFQGP